MITMSEIPTRLREYAAMTSMAAPFRVVLEAAANEIERLRLSVVNAEDRAEAADNEAMRLQEQVRHLEHNIANIIRALDEADPLIANLIGGGEFAGAYPVGSSKEQAIENWQRRAVMRDADEKSYADLRASGGIVGAP
jgi:hypothetical protein